MGGQCSGDQQLPRCVVATDRETIEPKNGLGWQLNEDLQTAQHIQHLRNCGAQTRILIPAALHQCPQLYCAGWMHWPRRPSPAQYMIHGFWGPFLAERNRTSEHLDGPRVKDQCAGFAHDAPLS